MSLSNVGILFKSPYWHYFTSVRFLIMICVLQTQPGLVEGWRHHTSCCLVLSFFCFGLYELFCGPCFSSVPGHSAQHAFIPVFCLYRVHVYGICVVLQVSCERGNYLALSFLCICVFALQLGSTGAFIFSLSPFVCMSRHCAILEGG